MDDSDRKLLERVVEKTGLSRTEVFRRGLRQIAGETFYQKPGFAFERLIANGIEGGPDDVSERHDFYLGKAYEQFEENARPPRRKKGRARLR
jgi:hypothetical protein